MEPMLGLIILGLVPILILWITIYRKWVHKYFVNTREIGSRITGKLNENISGAMIIEVFNKEADINKEYNDLTWNYVTNERKAQQLNNAFGFELLQFLKRLAEIALLMYLGFESISIGGAVLTIGLVAALVENLDKMINPFTTIFDSLNELEDAMVGATRCYLFIDEVNDTMTLEGELSPKLAGDVEFNNVSFEYVANTPILKNFTYKANRGMTVGIVGATGAGKSTLMNLLLRYNDYQSGSIKIDGYEIKNYNKQSYRENMGIVLQTPALFAGTIKSNVTLERDYKDEDVRNALIQVGAEDLLIKNNNDINAPVSFKGENLSLGEKQLICFARIILRNPAILVLDEATANIDSETEEKIQNAMHVISEKRTTFIIAHRLSTIKDADEIIVMSHGDIVGVGKHAELYKTCDTYKDMYDSQFKNYKN
jgi:ATP-binding cassette subfamily B protein